MVRTAGREFRNNLRRRPIHLLHHTATYRGQVDFTAAQDYDPFLAVGPFGQRQDRLKGVAADHQGIYAGHELVVTVRLASTGRQKVERAVEPCDKSIEARADEN